MGDADTQLTPPPGSAAAESATNVATSGDTRTDAKADAKQDTHVALYAAAQKLLAAPGWLDERRVRALQRQWNHVHEESADVDHTDTRIDACFEQLHQRLRSQSEQRERDHRTLQNALERLEQSLEAGHVNDALALRDQARNSLNRCSDVMTHRARTLTRRLKASERKLRELQDWRHWSTMRARRELVSRVEQLVDAELHPAQIAEQIRKARAMWKSWDRSGESASKSLWLKFDAACTKAYERPRAHFRAQAEARHRNLENQKLLCAQLESIYDETDWKKPDWKLLDKTVRKTRERWRKAASIDRKFRKPLEHRFRAIVEKFEDYLERERRRDVKRRQQLIDRAQQLQTSPDVDRALQQIKVMQHDWTPTVLSTRKVEDALWRDFRTACDAIFDRRQKLRHEQHQSLKANLEAKQSLCQQIESLTPIAPEGISDAEHRLSQLQRQWQQIGSVPANTDNKLIKQYKSACSRVASAITHAQCEYEALARDRLRRKATLCGELEAAVLSDPPRAVDIAELKEQFEACGGLDAETETAIAERFQRACDAQHSGSRAAELQRELQDNLMRKQELCLQLEILAEIDSPPEFAKARLEYQVRRLSAAMAHQDRTAQDQDTMAASLALMRTYWLTGAVSPHESVPIEARFERALQALRGSTRRDPC